MRHTRRACFLLLLLAAAASAACDVENPGPIDDSDLNDPSSHAGLVAGAGRMLVFSVNEIAYTGAVNAREILPGGQTGNMGHTTATQAGALLWDDGDIEPHWNNLQQARYIAEDAIRRFTEVVDPATVSPVDLAQAYIWAGYANRFLGANMCVAVFDGGPVEPHTKYLERAERHFGNALEIAQGDQRLTALAGRAQVRVLRGDWAGAAADAAEIPDDFAFMLGVDGLNFDSYNWLYWATANKPYRSYSVWHTWFEGYYTETGDPRTPWAEDPGVEFAGSALSGFGQVPWKFQTKYTTETDDYRLAGGMEMRLIEAEALLNEGRWQEAMARINAVRTRNVSDRTGEPLEPWQAGSLEEAWTFLKRERSIELWLEGHRFADLRRWAAASTPGALDWPDFESLSPIFSAQPRSTCFPIPELERQANPNVPDTPAG